MTERLRRIASSPCAHVGVLAAATLTVWSYHGLYRAPVLWDRAYFTYLGQSVLRGESFYATTFMGYPPLGPLLSAASMWVGRWFDLPTYLAPRYLAVGVGALCAAAIYLVTRRATGSAWSGMLAGVVLAAFNPLVGSSLSTLEPKVLVMLFTVAAWLAVQRRHWLAAGLAGGLAATCWQPAVLVALAGLGATIWGGRTASWRTIGAYAAGICLGLLPAMVYLAATDAWWDFWQRSVIIPAAAQLPVAATNPLRWLVVARDQFWTERIFFIAAGAGFAWYAVGTLRHGARGLPEAWLGSRLGGVPPLTLAWVVFNSVEFGNAPDMFPLLPAIAFWVAWVSHRLVSFLAHRVGQFGWSRAAHGLPNWAYASLLTAAAVYGLSDAPFYGVTLAREEFLVRMLVDRAGPEGTVMGISASEVYALTNRPSPNRFLRLTDAFTPFLPLVEPDGCPGVLRRMLERRPEVVVVALWSRSGECERRIGPALLKHGYQIEKFRVWRRVWDVYWMEKSASSAGFRAAEP